MTPDIRAACDACGITLDDLAELSGVPVENLLRDDLSAADRAAVSVVLITFAIDDPDDTALRRLRNIANGNALQAILEAYDAEQAREDPTH
ncbi:MAG TPA: hypothetical protein VI485_23105 [Vicinamibacterales bacterium]|nr:hypothetical protein [Vicinamibacterales bacterium]